MIRNNHMDDNLIDQLKQKAKEILETNTRFHCYAHAIEVLENSQKLIQLEDKENYDKVSIFAAALLHDSSNSQEKEVEGLEGAEIAGKILSQINGFPKEKIDDVQRLIKSLNENREKAKDEILLEASDQMAAFSDLGLIRSFIISGSQQMKIRDAIEWELTYLEKRFNKFKFRTAKMLVEEKYNERRKFLMNCHALYES